MLFRSSLKQVPVSMRIMRDVTGQGRFIKLKHVEAIEDLEANTIFYQPPVVRPDASFQVEFDLTDAGSYIGIVTAGHPSLDNTYSAVFAFEAGSSGIGHPGWLLSGLVLAALIVFYRKSARKPLHHSMEAMP